MKRVFITGGASGLGKALAHRFADEYYKVCIGDINEDRGEETLAELKKKGCDALFVHCNVTKEEDFAKVKDLLVKEWGGVDVVVNNAGVAGAAGKIDELTMKDWEWVLDVNLLGVVRGCRQFTPLFKKQNSGYFINIASAAGLINPPYSNIYNTTKAAVISLSEGLQSELGRYNVGVSAVCPAFFKTNLTESFSSKIDGMQKQVEKAMERSSFTAEKVADAIMRGMKRKQLMIVTHPVERGLWQLKRLHPGFFQKVKDKRIQKIIPLP